MLSATPCIGSRHHEWLPSSQKSHIPVISMKLQRYCIFLRTFVVCFGPLLAAASASASVLDFNATPAAAPIPAQVESGTSWGVLTNGVARPLPAGASGFAALSGLAPMDRDSGAAREPTSHGPANRCHMPKTPAWPVNSAGFRASVVFPSWAKFSMILMHEC